MFSIAANATLPFAGVIPDEVPSQENAPSDIPKGCSATEPSAHPAVITLDQSQDLSAPATVTGGMHLISSSSTSPSMTPQI